MSDVNRGVGLVLMIVGVGGYVLAGMTSPTALIPAAFGLVISMLGFYGRHEDTRRIATHLSMGIALAGILGSVSALPSVLAVVSGRASSVPGAAVSRSLMAVILLGYVAAGVRSFVGAPRRG